jgi:hypothetical protein
MPGECRIESREGLSMFSVGGVPRWLFNLALRHAIDRKLTKSSTTIENEVIRGLKLQRDSMNRTVR